MREDTAELASYALSDRASARSVSPPARQRQTNLDSYFLQGQEEEDTGAGLRRDTIHEVSEPVTPISGPSSVASNRVSTLTNMIRRSPPSTSPPDAIENNAGDRRHLHDEHDEEQNAINGRLIITSEGLKMDSTERTPLLRKKAISESHNHRHPDYINGEQDIEGQELHRKVSWPKLRTVIRWPGTKGMHIARTVCNPKSWDRKAIWQHAVVEPVGFLPSVGLGLLLNILDALSYGMILFPLGQPIFEKLGAAGISIFYVSCIISQIIFSGGGSAFKGGIGSEMIEVVPFFHKMAFTILNVVGEDKPEAVIATTITAYALSSILTGIVFFLMGTFHFGYIIGFIPRHILVGCIGGVGVFLIVTGIEVSARLDGNLNYDSETLWKLCSSDTFPLWTIPLILGAYLFTSQHQFSGRLFQSKYYLSGFILSVLGIFYFFVFSIDKLDVVELRRTGWIFNGPESGEPWYYFYTLYKFHLVDWDAILETIPAMFALTFFGILHVPINVPSLAFAIQVDDLDLDRELIAHGISNTVSGLLGSIQNYLVYTNSVIFIKSGGDSRVAGFMLATGTFGVLLIGPSIIGYIPVMVVGVLIFHLGFDLVVESVWTPRNKLRPLEYWTVSAISCSGDLITDQRQVVAIVLIMGVYDFVVGIFVGIALAFMAMVFQTSKVPAVRASYSGEIAGSTVRRNPAQGQYLRQVGQQIHVTKLAGYLFFGTIVSVEERIRVLLHDIDRPIRFLVLDLHHVTGLDYSAAEAFMRISRLCGQPGVALVISGVSLGSSLEATLQAVGLGSEGKEVKQFPDLNSALESCENELLKIYYASRENRASARSAPPTALDISSRPARTNSHSMDTQFSSPRRNQLQRTATALLNEAPPESRYNNFKEPLRLILQTFSGLTERNEDFWFNMTPFLVKQEYKAGSTLYKTGEAAMGFYLLESGVLRADYELPQGRYFESIVAGTTCGELPFFSNTDRTATVQAETDCVTWLLDRDSWHQLQKKEPDIANELLHISLKLTSERMSAITSYVLTTAG